MRTDGGIPSPLPWLDKRKTPTAAKPPGTRCADQPLPHVRLLGRCCRPDPPDPGRQHRQNQPRSIHQPPLLRCPDRIIHSR